MPFWLDRGSHPRFAQDPEKKMEAYEALANLIKAGLAGTEFQSIDFEALDLMAEAREQRIPDGLARRKGSFIRSSDMSSVIDDLIGRVEKALGEARLAHTHELRLLYYDYGCGYVSYKLVFELNDNDDYRRLNGLIPHLFDELIKYQEAKNEKLHRLMLSIDNVLGNAIEDGVIFENWLMIEQNIYSRLTWALSISMLSIIGKDEDLITIDGDTFSKLHNNLVFGEMGADRAIVEQQFPGIGRMFMDNGGTGSFVVADIRSSIDDSSCIRDRIETVVSLVWMFSNLAIEAIEATYTKQISLFGRDISNEKVDGLVGRIRLARGVVGFLHFESQDLALCTLPQDYFIYNSISEASELSDLSSSLEKSAQMLELIIDDMKIYETLKVRFILKWTAAIGASIATLATLVSILTYLDASSVQAVELNGARLVVVLMLAFVSLVTMVVFIHLSKRDIPDTRFLLRTNEFGKYRKLLAIRFGGWKTPKPT
jgi:hypothetical protein